MIDNAKLSVLNAKNARIIALLAKHFNNSLEVAADVFYQSETSQLIFNGIADLHCRSDQYLADEIYQEYLERNIYQREP